MTNKSMISLIKANSQGLVKQNISDVPNPSPPNEGESIGGKCVFVDPAISMVRFQSSTAGHRNFTLEMRAKRRQRLFFLFFSACFPVVFWIVGRNRSQTNAKHMS